MIQAKIVEDSIAPSGVRLTTFVLTYPRFIHSEFMTHRMFSRNASSSRAIPVKKSIQMVLENPVIPLAFTKNKPGMQGGDLLSGIQHEKAIKMWMYARDMALEAAEELEKLEVHKQYANRILEPFSHITVVCSATDYANFFALRCHPMAQPEIMALADLMYDEYQASNPKQMSIGDMHLPFVSDEERQELPQDDLIKMSVARCARVSYLNHEGKKPTLEEDITLYNRLVGSAPIHASPAEHQAIAMGDESRSGNFRGWIQYRKLLLEENIEEFKK